MPFANITFNVQTNLRYVANDFVKVYHDANNFILGRVVSYDAGTGSLVIAPTSSVGSGTYTSWNVELLGYEGSSGTSGSSGTTGTAGTAATSGTEGTSGSFGTSGSSATSGTSGTEGESSSSGTSGTTGTAGLDGESGSSASSGTSGTSGTAGTSGFSGSSGTSAFSGLSALSGSSGTSGTSGAAGPNGPTGPQGPTGPRGPQGPTGPGTPYNQALFTTSNVYFYNMLSGCAGIVYANSFRIPNGGRFVNSGDQGTPWYGDASNWYTFGACGATSFFTTSTREVKTNIEDFTRSALDIINSIEIVTFRYENLDTYLKVGFIADDAPEEVATKNHDQMVIPTTVNLAMKAIQELNQKIEILKNNKL